MKFDDWLTPALEKDNEREYKEYHHPWANYIIALYPGYKSACMDPNDTVENWCKENLIGKYNLEYYCYFELEEDSVMFTLRWC